MTPAPISVERLCVHTADHGDDRKPYGMMMPDARGEYVRHSDYAALLHQLAERGREVARLRDAMRDADAAFLAMLERAEAAERAREEARILIEDAGSALRVIIATAEAARWPITAEQMVPMNMARKEAGRIAAFLAASGGDRP